MKENFLVWLDHLVIDCPIFWAMALQTFAAIFLAAVSKIRLTHPIRYGAYLAGPILFGYSAINWWETVAGFCHGHIAIIFPIADPNGLVVLNATFWIFFLIGAFFWILAMFSGTLILTGCQSENGVLEIDRENPIIKLILNKLDVNITSQSNICNLSWSTSGNIFLNLIWYLICVPIKFVCVLIAALAVFFFTGRSPFGFIGECFSDYVFNWDRIKVFGIKNFKIIPIFWVSFISLPYLLLEQIPQHNTQPSLLVIITTLVTFLFSFILLGTITNYIQAQDKPKNGPELAGGQVRVVPLWIDKTRDYTVVTLKAAGNGIAWPFRMIAALKKGACPRIKIKYD